MRDSRGRPIARISRRGAGVMAVLAGAGLVVLFWLVNQSHEIKGGITTTGTIVGMSDSDDGGYFPIVEFTDLNGKSHRVTAVTNSEDRAPIGAKRKVSYKPSDPENAHILQRPSLFAYGIGFLVAGVFFVGGIQGFLFPNAFKGREIHLFR